MYLDCFRNDLCVAILIYVFKACLAMFVLREMFQENVLCLRYI